MKLKTHLAFFIFFTLISLTKVDSLSAQPSVLDKIMQAQAAVVVVKAQNSQFFKSEPSIAARDPKTGRVLVARNLSRASYERNSAGVIIHPGGIIVTNAHAIAKANMVTIVLQDGTALPAQVIRFVNDLDLALLKINHPQPLPYVALANSDAVNLGDEIMTTGNSPLLNQTISGGKVIGLGENRGLRAQGQKQTELLQTTMNLYPGDSGGPLFDRKGQLIGLMTAKESSADHSSFAIPSNKIAKYLEEYLNNEPISK